MNPKQERTRKRLADFQKIAKTPKRIWMNEHGIVSVPKTLTKNGYPCHTGFCNQLRSLLVDEGYVTGFHRATFKDGQTITGMRLGPKTVKMDNKFKNLPAVYAVVCEGSGKMYIGTTKNPMLRRSVHFFWLKNPEQEGTSNIFGRNVEIMEDLKKYGWESFYFEILATVDSGIRADMVAAEREMMELYHHNLYNLYRAHMKMRRYRTVRPNPRWKKADEKLFETREQINDILYELKQYGRGHPVRKRLLKKMDSLRKKRDMYRAIKRETGPLIRNEKYDIITGKMIKGS